MMSFTEENAKMRSRLRSVVGLAYIIWFSSYVLYRTLGLVICPVRRIVPLS